MKIDCVLTACNANPLYEEFIPLFIKAWRKLMPEIDIKIIYIHHEIPAHLQPYAQYITLFQPIDSISTAFTSQYIRLLYPCLLNYTNGVLITDIDILPMNRAYYVNNITQYTNDAFIYYRHVLMMEYREIAMCYNVATPAVWKQIFNVCCYEDIQKEIASVYDSAYTGVPGSRGWNIDQTDLYKRVHAWNATTKQFVYLRDDETGFRRLCRSSFHGIMTQDLCHKIKGGYFSDYHALRPYSRYKSVNDFIIDLL
jgi:hypothetical protein